MAIKEEIKYYINQKETNGALLITGAWGCGKSYLIKEIAQEYEKDKTAYIGIVSLFGITNCEQLNAIVKKTFFDKTAGTLTKLARTTLKGLGKVIDVGTDVASNFVPESKALTGVNKGSAIIPSFDILNFVTPKNSIKHGKQESPFVLVFDDLERCDIPIKNLLGIINDYCENKKIKTIIVAAEEKIDFESKQKDDNKDKSDNITENTYKEIKEKVVSNTLQLNPDYEKIIDDITKEYGHTNKDYKKFIKTNSKIIKESFFQSNYKNLRSLKCGITNFERIYDLWTKENIPMEKLPYIFFSFFAIMYEIKANQLSEGDFGSYGFKKGMREKYLFEGKNVYLLDIFCQWIDKGIWDEEIVTKDLKKRFLPKKDDLKFIYLHTPVWDIDFETTKKGLQLVLPEAYDGQLTGYELYGLLQRLQIYADFNFNFDFTVDYNKISIGMNKMIAQINQGNDANDYDRFFVESEFLGKANNDIKPLLLKLKYISENISSWQNQTQLIQALKNNSFDLYDFELKVFNEFDSDMSQEFYNCYCHSNNETKRSLAHLLLKINFTNTFNQGDFWLKALKATIDNLKQLETNLNGLIKNESDPITKYIEQIFSNSLKDKISALEKKLPKE